MNCYIVDLIFGTKLIFNRAFYFCFLFTLKNISYNLSLKKRLVLQLFFKGTYALAFFLDIESNNKYILSLKKTKQSIQNLIQIEFFHVLLCRVPYFETLHQN